MIVHVVAQQIAAMASGLVKRNSPESLSDNSSSPKLGQRSTDNGVAEVESHFVVAAIDFGTTYSGYAFSFTRDPESIHIMRKWEGGDPGVTNHKTPTTLLLKPNGDFHSFGFGARDCYHDLEEGEAKRWMYFEKFKMNLHSSQVPTCGFKLLSCALVITL